MEDPRRPDERADADAAAGGCREALTAAEFSRAWEQGAALDADAAAEWALAVWERELEAPRPAPS
jgi:hypothetical protein